MKTTHVLEFVFESTRIEDPSTGIPKTLAWIPSAGFRQIQHVLCHHAISFVLGAG